MAELTVPQIDFSSLGQLPELYRQGQANQLRQQTLASLGQGGQADATALLKSGDLSLAQLGINLRNRQEDQTRQASQDARQAERDKVGDQHWGASFELQKRAANRADEDKFAIKEITDPNTGVTSLVRVKTTGGEGPINTGVPASAPNNPFSYGKMNEAQSKDSGYANRMFRAEGVLRDPEVIAAGQSLTQRGLDSVPVAGQFATSPQFQKYDQAGRDFINAVLRRESGAAISSSEFDNAYKQYLPRPGDSKERLLEKQRNRQDTLASIAGGGGPAYKPPFTFGENGELLPTGAGKQGAAKPAPATSQGQAADTMLAHAREAITAGAPRAAVLQRLQQAGIDASGL